MKTFKLLSILSIILLLSSCSADNTDLDNLVGTKWKNTNITDDEILEYNGIFFKTATIYQFFMKAVGEVEEVDGEGPYLIDGDKILFKDSDGSVWGEGKIDKNELTITFIDSDYYEKFVKE